MTIKMDEQENLGVNEEILFKRLLAEMIEKGIVKYVDRVERGNRKRYYYL